MKKKTVGLLLAIAMTALVLTGCATGETTREIMENQVEEAEEPEVTPEETEETAEEAEEEKEAVEWTKEDWQESIYEEGYELYTNKRVATIEPWLPEEVMENIDWDEDLIPYLDYDWPNEEKLWLASLGNGSTDFILADLNEDGQRELIFNIYDWRKPGVTYIYTVMDGEVVYCGETLASDVRFDVDDNVKAIPYFPEEIFDVYQDPEGCYQLISYGYGNLHGGFGTYNCFETTYDKGQISYVPAFGTLYSVSNEDYPYRYWIEENGEDWKETIEGPYNFLSWNIYDWEDIKWDKAIGDDEDFTTLTRLLSEQYADYKKVEVTFQYSPHPLAPGIFAYYEEDQEAVRYNIRAGLAIAAGLAEAE